MGKRKSAAKPAAKKKREALSTAFQCLFCNHENSVTVKLDKKSSTGDLSCKVCGQSFQTGINYLSQAVDVYSDWVDACDAVAKDAADSTRKSGEDSYGGSGAPARAQRGAGAVEDDDDGFIENDELDAEAEVMVKASKGMAQGSGSKWAGTLSGATLALHLIEAYGVRQYWKTAMEAVFV
ncbi:hypothetical protein BT93_L5610 [Corymbia citriodora subsp. variegata]|uniref:Transcription elongation factor 1 homolog n=1 Tax=Corymbia citriodora subsp. variegata TaxID=360336 RepID=A0A8T0CF28_CORYI|nr:hypothetical protein BT93_L5610 [Corymbia citriodora subsp. variegata]